MESSRKFVGLLVLLSLSLCELSAASKVTLNCKFHGHKVYTCIATGLEIIDELSLFAEVSGRHAANKTNDNVAGLDVRGQNVSFVPQNIGKFFPNLLRYEVKNSSLISVKKENFEGLGKLEILVLVNNLIEALNSDVFDELSRLKNLRLSGNKLKHLHYATFSRLNLEVVMLDHNKLEAIHENLLGNLGNLKEIYLQNNAIEDLRERIFGSNEKLEYIDLSNNRIKSVGPKLLVGLESLKTFNFSNNDCITLTYNSTDDLADIFTNFCYPPYYKEFKEEIDSLKSAQLALNEALRECEVKFTEEAEKSEEFETKLSDVRSEVDTAEATAKECDEAKQTAETSLASCETEKQEKIDTFEKVNASLFECKSQEKISLDQQIFYNETVSKSYDNLKRCQLDVHTMKTAIKLGEIDTKLRNENDGRVNALESDKAELQSKLDEIASQLQSRLNDNASQLKKRDDEIEKLKGQIRELRGQPKGDSSAELKKCQKDFEDLRASQAMGRSTPNECVASIAPICSTFLIDCAFQRRLNDSDYACKAKHVSACQPNMKLSSVEGTHTHGKSINDVNVLEIRDSIFRFTNDIFRQLPHLRKFVVKNSALSSLEPKLNSLQLRQLEIEENELKAVPGGIFSEVGNLESLQLNTNGIEKLDSDSFAGLSKLIVLDLKDNHIVSLPESVFSGLSSLKQLSVKNNKLRSLPGNLLHNNLKLEIVKFDDNRQLNTIGLTLLDYLKDLRMAHFTNTCVGQGYESDMRKLSQDIKAKCQN